MKAQNNPPLCNVKDTKEFFSSAMKNMFSPVIKERSIYTEGNVSGTLRNAIADHLCIETYVRNYGNTNTPSGDTMFRLLKGIASESGSHRRKGSDMVKSRKTVRTGMEKIQSLLDLINLHGCLLNTSECYRVGKIRKKRGKGDYFCSWK